MKREPRNRRTAVWNSRETVSGGHRPSKALQHLKQAARKLKRSTGIPHHEALERVAKFHDLHHWHQVSEDAKRTAPTESAYRTGLIIAMDMKEAMDYMDDDDGPFVADSQAEYFCWDDLFKDFINSEDEETGTPLKDSMPMDSLRSVFKLDVLSDYLFFRYTGHSVPDTLEGALDLVRQWSFWLPEYVWLRGHFYNTYGAPATDDEGNPVGVRL